MTTTRVQPRSGEIWALVRRQHGVVSRRQLLGLGVTAAGIRHRLRSGRLYPVMRGVYAVGRPDVPRHGRLMAAVLACGVPEAMLSHRSAAELWGLVEPRRGRPVDVSVPLSSRCCRDEIRIHRRTAVGAAALRRVRGIPVTDPVTTLIDFASEADGEQIEGAVNEASHRDLVDPETLRAVLADTPPRPGVRPLRRLLDRDTFVLTQTVLERRFLRLVRTAGVPLPESQAWLGEHRVDFHWPEFGLVVECDSLRYHRTALKQAEDMRRDQAHVLAGRNALRFNHYQVRYEPDYVVGTLRTMFARMAGSSRRERMPSLR